MKSYGKTLTLATAILALPLCTLPSYSASAQSSSSQATAPIRGHREAAKMVPANAELMRTLDAKKDQPNAEIKAKLRSKATLSDGTVLPSGTILIGHVVQDDMQVHGMSKLALCFNEAHLKNGKTVPVKATIVSIFQPGMDETGAYPTVAGDQVPNSWNDGTLQIDQIGVIPGVDLHSRIASKNSGVFVSTKKDDMKLDQGSEIQLAIGPQMSSSSSVSSSGQS
ncbi:MAG TPA: hypothetical protein VGR96_02735 [Acidobacteriaceae bacterium]|nr:hypothetical protein [Acidobacteriaceae bacterium]